MQHGEKQAAVYLFLKEFSFPVFLTFLFLHQLRGAIVLEGVKCRDQLWVVRRSNITAKGDTAGENVAVL